MKKPAILLFVTALATSCGAPSADAIDFKARGEWVMSFDYGQNGNFTGGHGQTGYTGTEDEFEARQRIRLQLDAVASESLSGTLFFEIGSQLWGKGGDSPSGGAVLGADSTHVVKVRRAHVDWDVPNTRLKVRMGLQGLLIPSYSMGKSQIFEDDVAGVSLAWQFADNAMLVLSWARPYNDNSPGDGTRPANHLDNIDAVGMLLPLYFDGFKIMPFGIFGAMGPNAFRLGERNFGNIHNTGVSNSEVAAGIMPAWGIAGSDGRSVDGVRLNRYTTAWWAGFTADLTALDPFRIAFDFMGGATYWDDSRLNRAGWLAALLVEYRMDWGIPGLVAWYATGDNSDLGDGSERMPHISIGNSDNDFSHYALDGHPYIAREGVLGSSMTGTWGVGLRVKDVSLLEDLKHSLRVNLIGGTNNHNIFRQLAKLQRLDVLANDAAGAGLVNGNGVGFSGMYLTDQDTALEVSLQNEFRVYENFKIMVDASYVALWLADTKYEGVRRQLMGATGASSETRDAWNVNVSFIYSF